MKAAAAVLLTCALLAGTPALAVEPGAGWAIRLPATEPVVFRGALNLDAPGSAAGGMLYPAPHVAGFLVAILTHAVIAESSRNAEKARQQEEADKVLSAFRPLLEGFKHSDLAALALPRVEGTGMRTVVGAQERPSGWLIAIAPVFSMTQDRRAIFLDNAIAFYRPGEAEPSHAVAVRVVSAPRAGPDPEADWQENVSGSARLKDESAHLLAHSISIAMNDLRLPRAEAAAFRTVRYPEGAGERVERAQLVTAGCERVVLRTLRGALMSVPAPGEAGACPEGAPGWR
jgi:hypothetical protein